MLSIILWVYVFRTWKVAVDKDAENIFTYNLGLPVISTYRTSLSCWWVKRAEALTRSTDQISSICRQIPLPSLLVCLATSHPLSPSGVVSFVGERWAGNAGWCLEPGAKRRLRKGKIFLGFPLLSSLLGRTWSTTSYEPHVLRAGEQWH